MASSVPYERRGSASGGGCKIEDLYEREEVNYSSNLIKPVYGNIKAQIPILKKKVEEIQIKLENKNKIKCFKIGKTYAELKDPKNKKQNHLFDEIKKDGIGSRWQQYKKDGYDGLICIGIFSDKLIDPKDFDSDIQRYVLTLEKTLIGYYMETDRARFANPTKLDGKLSTSTDAVFLLYFAYCLEGEKRESEKKSETKKVLLKDVVKKAQKRNDPKKQSGWRRWETKQQFNCQK